MKNLLLFLLVSLLAFGCSRPEEEWPVGKKLNVKKGEGVTLYQLGRPMTEAEIKQAVKTTKEREELLSLARSSAFAEDIKYQLGTFYFDSVGTRYLGDVVNAKKHLQKNRIHWVAVLPNKSLGLNAEGYTDLSHGVIFSDTLWIGSLDLDRVE